MMIRTLLGLSVVAAFAVVVQSAAVHTSLLCLSCHNIRDPLQCNAYEKCHHDELCHTEVHSHNGENLFTLSCKQNNHCTAEVHPVGRRAGGNVCTKCCSATGCNRDLCPGYGPQAQTTVPTTATTTLASCRDKEEDGILCSSYDKYNFCTDTSSIAHDLAHTKCPKHCRFCGVTTTPVPTTTTAAPVTTTQAVCEDREDANFKCTDRLDLCIDTSYFAQQLALDRCPKFCGLCGQTPTASTNDTIA